MRVDQSRQEGQTRAAVQPKFAAADLLLFTSRQGFEGSPMVVKEATAIGLPVVSTDVGDVADVLRNVTPSAVVEFDDNVVQRLVDKAYEVLADGRRANGREANAGLDWAVIAHQVIAHYRRVLDAASARA